MDREKNLWKIAAFLLLFFLVTTSAAQAIIKINTSVETTSDDNNITILNDETYTWEDLFENGQKIDMSKSDNYILDQENDLVRMDGTYNWWTDPSWTRAKIIELDNDLNEEDSQDVAIKLIIEHDSDMKSDYGDLRFRYNGAWLDYWIEDRSQVDAIFWVKISTLDQGTSYMYMFYGNSNANDQSDYWSVFDENSWQSEHVHDERVTNHMDIEGAWDPDVCYGNNKFLVTWEEGTAYWLTKGTIFKQQIRGCFYNTDGEPISNRFDIVDEPYPDNPLKPYRFENPNGAYDSSGKFLVAFEKYENPITNGPSHKERHIEGVIVTSAKEYDENDRFVIADADNIQADPRIAYDPNYNNGQGRFLVVWEDSRAGYSNYDIWGRFIDSNGNPDGGAFSLVSGIPHEAQHQLEPWIAFNHINNQYIVVWEESANEPDEGPFEIWGQIYDKHGGALSNSLVQISEDSSSNIDYNFPSVAFCENTEKFLVAWNQDDISSGDYTGSVYGRFIDENGNIDPNIIPVASGQFTRTDIVPYLETSFFVAYDNFAYGNPNTGDIWGKMVNNDGTVNQYTIRLSDDGSDACDWVNIGSSGSKIFVAWEDESVQYGNGFDEFPDVYFNVWSLNTPSGEDVSYDIGDELSLILEAHIVSVEINPVNWQEWVMFDADKTGNVDFDILDGKDPNNVIMADVSPGRNIESISSSSIRLKARFSRNNPSADPLLNSWQVTYYGKDEIPPITEEGDVVGTMGLNNYYKSQNIKIYLEAYDLPEESGSGVYKTYYRIDDGTGWGQTMEFNEFIHITADDETKHGEWRVNYWSEDNKGNIENRNKEANTKTYKIDYGIPFVTITEPTNEQRLDMGFWVRSTAGDNVGLTKVEFDVSPFGERGGLPVEVESPPYEWYCDVEEIKTAKAKPTKASTDIEPLAGGVNLWIRAYAYDAAGWSYYSEIVVYITDWGKDNSNNDVSKNKVFIGDRPILEKLKLGFAFDKTLDVKTPNEELADSVKIVATKILTRKTFTLWDNDLSNGCSASFNIPSGFYKITTYTYKENEQITKDIIARVLYINK